MEIGEVDLNYVLQQQAKLHDRKKSSNNNHSENRFSFNMNFVRLTWQQMLSAVYSIHTEHGIVHGDLKPANFLFVKGALKLIDFGIAKAIPTDENTTNIYRDSQVGTLNYMSPEAIMGTTTSGGGGGMKMKLGRASDIWSLGCILYQMVYDKTPFADLHMLQKMHAIIDPAHKISYPDGADEAAVDAMQLCLRRKPEERPPIVGKNGLLNEHWFLHSSRRQQMKVGIPVDSEQ
jgi:serine/threonine-protein kinase TTK/MPS1